MSPDVETDQGPEPLSLCKATVKTHPSSNLGLSFYMSWTEVQGLALLGSPEIFGQLFRMPSKCGVSAKAGAFPALTSDTPQPSRIQRTTGFGAAMRASPSFGCVLRPDPARSKRRGAVSGVIGTV